MNKDLISIIVPVYNVSSYLDQCIDSLLNQTYSNIEIILVDDGSTDSSGSICDQYAKRDGRIIVIHQTNAGLSSARNSGLNAVHGSYVGFVDGDDFCYPTMYETLYQELTRSQADLAICGYNRLIDEQLVKVKFPYPKLMDSKNFLASLFNFPKFSAKHVHGSTCVNKLYPIDLIGDTRFRKTSGSEDETFLFELSSKLRKVTFIPQNLYVYRLRSGSLSTREGFFQKSYASRLDLRQLSNTRLQEKFLKLAIIKMNIDFVWKKLLNTDTKSWENSRSNFAHIFDTSSINEIFSELGMDMTVKGWICTKRYPVAKILRWIHSPRFR